MEVHHVDTKLEGEVAADRTVINIDALAAFSPP
jgi:hypothetical protein